MLSSSTAESADDWLYTQVEEDKFPYTIVVQNHCNFDVTYREIVECTRTANFNQWPKG
jgi:hypothetical protein